jgi:uncharacterized protein with PhoU and TrkA domain
MSRSQVHGSVYEAHDIKNCLNKMRKIVELFVDRAVLITKDLNSQRKFEDLKYEMTFLIGFS